MNAGVIIITALSILVAALILMKLFTKGTYLKAEHASEEDVRGLFTLFFYRPNDPRQAVIFDSEGDEYTFEMCDSTHTYSTVHGVAGDQALNEARAFINSQRVIFRKVLHAGKAVGYEMRPLYQTLRYGVPDILYIDYRLEGKKVFVSVNVKSSIRARYNQELFGGG
jgi:hypothetical protein